MTLPTVYNIFGHTAPNKMSDKQSLQGIYTVPLRMGIEIELEGVRLSGAVPTAWDAIPDNSLRDGGVEFVLKKPLYGEQLTASLDAVCNYMQQHPYSLSHRCSVHVHMDFREADITLVERFFILYMLLEPSLYTMSSKDRYNNIYCPGLTHTTELIKIAAGGFLNQDLVEVVAHWNKYTGINLCPLGNLGSVEIRTHSGTIDYNDLVKWTEVLNALYAAACSLSLEEINKVSSAQELVELVFPDHLQPEVLCDNLILYFNNAKLNLHYYNVVQQLLIAEAEHQPIKSSSVELDDEYINNILEGM